MQVHFGADLLRAEWHQSVACIGTFDGVHLGHQAVIAEALRLAREADLPCILVTFDRHPAAILAPDRCPQAVASLAENLREFERLGVSLAVVLPFTADLSQTTASDFLATILQGKLRADSLVVGHDFAFGKGREGSPEWLAGRIRTTVVPPFELDGRRVSSSEIRRDVTAGRVEAAARLLGRPFEFGGIVVAGEKLGRELGWPTVNLARSFDQVVPAHGIYAGHCETSFGTFRAAISIGTRPAAGGKHRTIEAYLLDYPGHSLYGENVWLRFERRLRDEMDFPSLEHLKLQIASDVEEVARNLP